MCSSVRKRSVSSAKAASLYSLSAVCIPLMFGLALRQRRRGSMVSVNSNGERGQPCLIPLRIRKAFDRKLLTQTRAMGLVYRAIMKLNRRLPKPMNLRTASI